jgi:hypothetical protein
VLFLITLLTSLVDIWDLLDRLLRIEETDRQFDDKLGETYPNVIELSTKIVKLDFVKGEHQNIPVGEIIEIPYCPVREVVIFNSGATDIGFSTSANLNVKSDQNAGVLVQPNETWTVTSPRNTITRVNIVAPSGNGQARVTLTV